MKKQNVEGFELCELLSVVQLNKDSEQQVWHCGKGPMPQYQPPRQSREKDFSWMLVAMEKLKVEPMDREKVKDWAWLASVWQRPKHWEVKEALSSPTAVILFSLLN